jgi:hypothetical protein
MAPSALTSAIVLPVAFWFRKTLTSIDFYPAQAGHS